MDENGITFKLIPSEFLATLEKRFTPKPLYESDAYFVVVYEVTKEKIREIPYPNMREFLECNMRNCELLIVCEKKHPAGVCYSGEKSYTPFSGDVGGIIRCFEAGDIHFCERSINPIEI